MTLALTVLCALSLQARQPQGELTLFTSIARAAAEEAVTIVGAGPRTDTLFVNATSILSHASMLVGVDVPDTALEPLLTVPHRLVSPGTAFSCDSAGCRMPGTGVYFELNGLVRLPNGRAEVIWTLKWIWKTPGRSTIGFRITRAWFRHVGREWVMERSEGILQT